MTNQVVLGLLLAFACSSSIAQDSCPAPWIQYQESCYYVVDTELSWFAADQHCTFLLPFTYKAHLVAIETPLEQQFITNLLSSEPGYRNRNFWTSGNIIARQRGWSWASTNEVVGYQNWSQGEPNGSGDCVQIWGEFDYGWDDAFCYGDINFICEAKLSDVIGN